MQSDRHAAGIGADGSETGTMPVTAEASIDPVAVAVTIEPAGGVPSPAGSSACWSSGTP